MTEYFDIVKLYYPNTWKQNVGNIVPVEDKKFNWFLCSKKYRDEHGIDVIEIKPGIKFYNEKTGVNYILKNTVTLLALEGKKSLKPTRALLEGLNSRYHGFAIKVECLNYDKSSIVCPEVIFSFIKGTLDPIDKEACPLIEYSKTRYQTIKSKIHDFPSPDDIDNMIKKTSREEVCKLLYEKVNQ